MTRKSQETAAPEDTQLIEAVRNSAQQIWQAGLGAFIKARQEGSEAFNRLVQEGAELQSRTHQMAGEKMSDVTAMITKMAETIGKQTAGSLGKMEEVFEERVSRTLRSIGVPTHEDIAALTTEIEDLRKSVKALSAPRSANARAAAKPAAKKNAVKAAGKTLVKTSAKTPAKSSGKKTASKAGNGSALKKTGRSAASHA